jgi:hypothetical protein
MRAAVNHFPPCHCLYLYKRIYCITNMRMGITPGIIPSPDWTYELFVRTGLRTKNRIAGNTQPNKLHTFIFKTAFQAEKCRSRESGNSLTIIPAYRRKCRVILSRKLALAQKIGIGCLMVEYSPGVKLKLCVSFPEKASSHHTGEKSRLSSYLFSVLLFSRSLSYCRNRQVSL